jgi:hypothetical protein
MRFPDWETGGYGSSASMVSSLVREGIIIDRIRELMPWYVGTDCEDEHSIGDGSLRCNDSIARTKEQLRADGHSRSTLPTSATRRRLRLTGWSRYGNRSRYEGWNPKRALTEARPSKRRFFTLTRVRTHARRIDHRPITSNRLSTRLLPSSRGKGVHAQVLADTRFPSPMPHDSAPPPHTSQNRSVAAAGLGAMPSLTPAASSEAMPSSACSVPERWARCISHARCGWSASAP